MPLCDAVIVNFNAGPFLKETIETALASASIAKVYLVDNASTDGSTEGLDFGDRLVVIKNDTNLGFSTAANRGLAQTNADYVLFLNPDCRIMPGAVERLINALEGQADAGMSGPLLLNPDGSEQAGGRRRIPTPRLAKRQCRTTSRRWKPYPAPA